MPRSHNLLGVFAMSLLLAAGCGGKRTRAAKPARIGATETGVASWYGHPYHGRRAANGEVYDMDKLTAAHRTLPFGTWLRVKNLSNSKEVEVRIQDRGPFVGGRILDLSRAAAKEIEMIGPGTTRVKLTIIARPSPKEPDRSDPVRESVSAAAAAFAVQVGAFSDRSRAERLFADVKKYGPARIEIRDGPAPLHRVLVGECLYIEDAQELLARVEADGGSGLVVRLDR